jgi:hypothetical protein
MLSIEEQAQIAFAQHNMSINGLSVTAMQNLLMDMGELVAERLEQQQAQDAVNNEEQPDQISTGDEDQLELVRSLLLSLNFTVNVLSDGALLAFLPEIQQGSGESAVLSAQQGGMDE